MAAKVSEFGDSIMWHVTWLQRVYFETRNTGMNMTTEPTTTTSISTPPSSVTHRAHNFALVSYFTYIICPFYYSLDASYQFETLICSVLGFNIASMKEHDLQSFLLNLIHNQGWDRTMTTHLLYFTAKFLHGVYQCWYSYVWLPSCHGCVANSVFLHWSPLSLDMIRWWVTCCHMCSA